MWFLGSHFKKKDKFDLTINNNIKQKRLTSQEEILPWPYIQTSTTAVDHLNKGQRYRVGYQLKQKLFFHYQHAKNQLN